MNRRKPILQLAFQLKHAIHGALKLALPDSFTALKIGDHDSDTQSEFALQTSGNSTDFIRNKFNPIG